MWWNWPKSFCSHSSSVETAATSFSLTFFRWRVLLKVRELVTNGDWEPLANPLRTPGVVTEPLHKDTFWKDRVQWHFYKGTSINDFRFFRGFLTYPFQPNNVRFFGSFWTPLRTLKSDVINGRSLSLELGIWNWGCHLLHRMSSAGAS